MELICYCNISSYLEGSVPSIDEDLRIKGVDLHKNEKFLELMSKLKGHQGFLVFLRTNDTISVLSVTSQLSKVTKMVSRMNGINDISDPDSFIFTEFNKSDDYESRPHMPFNLYTHLLSLKENYNVGFLDISYDGRSKIEFFLSSFDDISYNNVSLIVDGPEVQGHHECHNSCKDCDCASDKKSKDHSDELIYVTYPWYRAWCKVDNAMYYSAKPLINIIESYEDSDYPLYKEYRSVDLLVSAGSFDDRNQMIYLSDIVLIETEDGFNVSEVIYRKEEDAILPGFGFNILKSYEYCPDYIDNEEDSIAHEIISEYANDFLEDDKSVIVIGNMYESKELLKLMGVE